MIILQAAKYLIFDMCMDVFFKRVESNFKLSSENSAPKINDLYSKIMAKDNRETFYNCRILDIYKDEQDTYIDFEYEEYTLNDYDMDDDDEFDSFIPDEEERLSVEDILAEEEDMWEEDLLGVETIRYSDYIFIR